MINHQLRLLYLLAFPLTGFEARAASKKLKSSDLALGLGFGAAAGAAVVVELAAGTGAAATVGSNCPGKQVANDTVGCLPSTCNFASVFDFDILMGIMHCVQLATTVSALTLLGNLPFSSPMVNYGADIISW